MKISDMLKRLLTEMENRGDVEVVFHSLEGSLETCFEVIPYKDLLGLPRSELEKLHINVERTA